MDECELVLGVILRMLREEYPEHLTLVEIVSTWGNEVTDDEIEAIRRFDAKDRNRIDGQP